MRFIKVLLLVIFFFLSMVFFIQNTGVLSAPMSLKMELFNYSYTSQELPFYLVILLAFAVGGIFSLLYFIVDKVVQMTVISKQKAKIASLEREVSALKSAASERVESTYPAATPSDEAEESEQTA
ncbi:LapA family protein [Desulfovibrio inopinatus]|uniref:LapA family protein n=1 Tax=Desulfovibrio inopinatus TaxID=102109 RepID=UPI0003F4D0A6|nr:LapA family protein [Desulfovibrio inopinatus]